MATFALFYLGDRVFHLDRDHVQTLMYLKLSVAGHMTIFVTRTRGPLWSIRPARVLLLAVLGTQTIATLIAVYGLFMTPLGWGLALFVWGYAVAGALLNDRLKLLTYRMIDRAKAQPKPHAKTKSPSELALQSEQRLHRFYEKLGRRDVQAVQEWEKAARGGRKGPKKKNQRRHLS